MILSFVKIDVSAAICKMTEIYIYRECLAWADQRNFEYFILRNLAACFMAVLYGS